MTENKHTYDTPWKQIIEFFFPQFMEFFVPGSKEDIDWNSKVNYPYPKGIGASKEA